MATNIKVGDPKINIHFEAPHLKKLFLSLKELNLNNETEFCNGMAYAQETEGNNVLQTFDSSEYKIIKDSKTIMNNFYEHKVHVLLWPKIWLKMAEVDEVYADICYSSKWLGDKR